MKKQVVTQLNEKERKALRVKMAQEGYTRQVDAIRDAINAWTGIKGGDQ